jgi:tetratricopeptide (TPR) repeat protein
MIILPGNKTLFFLIKAFMLIFFLRSIISCTHFDSSEQKAWKELNQKAYLNYQKGNFYKGVQWMEKACDYAIEHFGQDHPDTLSSMKNLILFYMEQGRKTEAEPLLIKLIEASKKAFGDHHHFTVGCMDRLGAFYVTTGQLKKALSLYNDLLVVKKEALGDHHPAVRNVLNNLAAIYSGLKELDQAEQMYGQIIDFKVSTHKKKDDVSIDEVPLNARLDLAKLYESQHKYDLAEKQYMYVYEYYRDQKGENDHKTLTTMHYLAQLYGMAEAESKALELYEKGYHICQNHRTSTDSLLFMFQKNRAILKVQLRQGKLAETAMNDVLKKSIDLYGQYDPNTIMIMYYSGIQKENMGNIQQAENIFKTVLTHAKAIFGETHFMTETIEKHFSDFMQHYHPNDS